jgi:hypothetical protein
MRRESGGGETSQMLEMKSNAVRKAMCESTRDSVEAQSEIKWARSFAMIKAKIRRRAIAATVDSPSYPVSKMDWFQSSANSTYGQSTQTTSTKAKRICNPLRVIG